METEAPETATLPADRYLTAGRALYEGYPNVEQMAAIVAANDAYQRMVDKVWAQAAAHLAPATVVPEAPARDRRWHPLGYREWQLRLFGCTVRWRAWSGGGSDDPHNHRWGFLAVPFGRFRETRWRSVEGSTYRIFDTYPPDGSGDRRVADTGMTADLVLDNVYTRRWLRPYRCRFGEIHAYQPIGEGRRWSLVFCGRQRTTGSQRWVGRG